jgi:hypothetical protein
MFPFSWLSILFSEDNSNPKADIRCPMCGERLRIYRNGHYFRYLFGRNETMAVQRYGCRNPGCPRRTFSIPPHPYLPICRIPLCALMAIVIKFGSQKHSVNRCARWLNSSWNTAKRGLMLAGRILDWFTREAEAGVIPIMPCLPNSWHGFIRAYSYAFCPPLRQ